MAQTRTSGAVCSSHLCWHHQVRPPLVQTHSNLFILVVTIPETSLLRCSGWESLSMLSEWYMKPDVLSSGTATVGSRLTRHFLSFTCSKVRGHWSGWPNRSVQWWHPIITSSVTAAEAADGFHLQVKCGRHSHWCPQPWLDHIKSELKEIPDASGVAGKAQKSIKVITRHHWGICEKLFQNSLMHCLQITHSLVLVPWCTAAVLCASSLGGRRGSDGVSHTAFSTLFTKFFTLVAIWHQEMGSVSLGIRSQHNRETHKWRSCRGRLVFLQFEALLPSSASYYNHSCDISLASL